MPVLRRLLLRGDVRLVVPDRLAVERLELHERRGLLDDVALDGFAGLELEDVELGGGGGGHEERAREDERAAMDSW